MDKNLKRAQSLVGSSEGRPADDFYPTPPEATQALLDAEKFDGVIWEPACGEGHISKVLEENGYEVKSTDLNYRGFGEGDTDFLKSMDEVDNVITNPPYVLAQEFVEHALVCSKKKVAMLCKLQFLEGAKRKKMFEKTPLARVYVFSKRLTMTRNGEKMKNSGMIAFAWLVWDHAHTGEPVIRWL